MCQWNWYPGGYTLNSPAPPPPKPVPAPVDAVRLEALELAIEYVRHFGNAEWSSIEVAALYEKFLRGESLDAIRRSL